VEYLVIQYEWQLVNDVFGRPEWQRYARYLCRRRGWSSDQIEKHLEDVLFSAVHQLISSRLLPDARVRVPSNDDRQFLHAWCTISALPDTERRKQQMDLIGPCIDNTIRRIDRANRRQPEVIQNEEFDSSQIPGSNPTGNRLSRLELEEEIQKLPEQQSQVLLLRLYEGLTFKEIAERLERPVATVFIWWTRGLNKLRDRLI
jgi:RNA polymerase sigma factor (sigma-70 family)